MAVATVLQSITVLVDAASCARQIQYSRSRRLVAGLSHDSAILVPLSLIVSVLSSLIYLNSSLVALQYANRYPIHPSITVSVTILCAQFTAAIIQVCGSIQTLFLYRGSKSEYQGISATLWTICALFTALWLAALRIYYSGLLFLLDIIDLMWLMAKICSVVAGAPQLFVNCLLELVDGQHRDTFYYQLVAASCLVAAKVVSRWEYVWWDTPLNLCTWIECASRLLALFLFYVEKRVYSIEAVGWDRKVNVD